MKIRLFCFLSATFLLAGLLMPVGVYAEDVPGVDARLTIETNADGDVAASCESGETSSTAVTTAEPVAVEDDSTSTDVDATGTTSSCGDDDGGFSRVSWNS